MGTAPSFPEVSSLDPRTRGRQALLPLAACSTAVSLLFFPSRPRSLSLAFFSSLTGEFVQSLILKFHSHAALPECQAWLLHSLLHFPTHKSPSISSNAAERETRLSSQTERFPHLDPWSHWPFSPNPNVVRVFILRQLGRETLERCY